MLAKSSCLIPAFMLAGLLMEGNPAHAGAPHDIVAPPTCMNSKGEAVQFVDRENSTDGSGLASGMAIRDSSGTPSVFRSNYRFAPPEFQRFIDRHECAHHQTGDVDLPHPPRNSPEHLMNESISDCIAILRLRDEEGYGKQKVGLITEALGRDMAQIGFPEISISSRVSNIENCFLKSGGPEEYVRDVLEFRGLN